jgi:hypothetical protein
VARLPTEHLTFNPYTNACRMFVAGFHPTLIPLYSFLPLYLPPFPADTLAYLTLRRRPLRPTTARRWSSRGWRPS